MPFPAKLGDKHHLVLKVFQILGCYSVPILSRPFTSCWYLSLLCEHSGKGFVGIFSTTLLLLKPALRSWDRLRTSCRHLHQFFMKRNTLQGVSATLFLLTLHEGEQKIPHDVIISGFASLFSLFYFIGPFLDKTAVCGDVKNVCL